MQGPSLLTQTFLFSRILFLKTKNLCPNIYKNRQKKKRGAAPRTPSLWGCIPPPHQVGAKCLPAVVLDN